MDRTKSLGKILEKITPALLALLVWAVPHLSRAQGVGLDGLLSGMALGLEDQAKKSAAHVIQEKVISQLCGKKEVSWVASDKSVVKLQVGCPDNSCDEGTTVYFKDSCKLLKSSSLNITDPFILKTISHDMVEFLFRLALSAMPQDQYDKMKMISVADFTYSVIEKMTDKNADVHELADPIEALANSLDSNYIGGYLDEVKADSSHVHQDLIDSVKVFVTNAKNKKECFVSGSQPVLEAQGAIGTLFNDEFLNPKDKSKDYHLALNAPCAMTGLKGAALRSCVEDKLIVSVVQPLQKITSLKASVPSQAAASLVRNIYYLLAEVPMYEGDIAAVDKNNDSIKKLEAWKDSMVGLLDKAQNFPPHEVANFLRVIAYSLDADRTPQGHRALEGWFGQLTKDMDNALNDATGDPIAALLHGTALGTAGNTVLDPAVKPLRDIVKEILALPRLQIARLKIRSDNKDIDPTKTIAALENFILSIRDLNQIPGASVEEVMAHLSSIVDSFSGVVAAVHNNNDEVEFFKQVAALLKDISGRDWVALAQAVGDYLQKVAPGSQFDSRVLVFMRTLMEMYQAKSVDEAKTIFLASIEDVSSRENRYGDFTIDVAGMVAGRDGFETIDGSKSYLIGLYAPVGLQFASHFVGVLAYPVDLGTYLVNSQGSSTSSQVSDALRVGFAGYIRLFPDIPIDLGGGIDFKPASNGASEVRRDFIFASLEMPLFLLH